MKTQLIIMAALFTVMPLAGCASMVSGPSGKVQFTSQPGNAQVTVVDVSRKTPKTVFTGTTPATATLKRGAGFFQPAKYMVTFTKDGYTTLEQKIKTGINGWYIGGNFIFGGLIGYLVVDPLTGAMWTLEGNCSAQLKPAGSASVSDGNGLTVVSMDQVPPNPRPQLRRVN
jgi:hypothetical protein